MSAPEGWGENRHAPAAATADAPRDTIGVWSVYNLPQKYIDDEFKRAVESSSSDPSPFGWTVRGNKSSMEELSRSSSAVTRTVASVNLGNNFAFLTPPPEEGEAPSSSTVSDVKAAATGPKETKEHSLVHSAVEYSKEHKEHSAEHSKEHSAEHSKEDKSEAVLNMLVGAVLQMDARMKRMEEMLERLINKS